MNNTKKTKVELLLETLSDGEWHWNEELAIKVGWRFNDPVHKARKQGHPIERDQDGTRHRYRLRR